jgi:hypothetical protein
MCGDGSGRTAAQIVFNARCYEDRFVIYQAKLLGAVFVFVALRKTDYLKTDYIVQRFFYLMKGKGQ